MINLDKDYLGHSFHNGGKDVADFNDIFTCSRCNIQIKMFLAEDMSDYNPRVIVEMQVKYLKLIGDILTQTCDETIIKGIIE